MHAKETIIDARLAFFEKMSASISHDLKNCLTIINEHAGLLEDMALYAHKDPPLNPDRLKGLSLKLKKQVQRANRLVVNMNRFAGSFETPAMPVDLVESLKLMCALSSRSAAMRDKRLKPDFSDCKVEIVNLPALVNQMIWVCIEDAIAMSGDSPAITLTLRPHRNDVKVVFRPVTDRGISPSGLLHRQETGRNLLSNLGASVIMRADNDEMVLSILRN